MLDSTIVVSLLVSSIVSVSIAVSLLADVSLIVSCSGISIHPLNTADMVNRSDNTRIKINIYDLLFFMIFSLRILLYY
jgi:hypothetical protein